MHWFHWFISQAKRFLYSAMAHHHQTKARKSFKTNKEKTRYHLHLALEWGRRIHGIDYVSVPPIAASIPQEPEP